MAGRIGNLYAGLRRPALPRQTETCVEVEIAGYRRSYRSNRRLTSNVLLATPTRQCPIRMLRQPGLRHMLPLYHATCQGESFHHRTVLRAIVRRAEHAEDKYKLNHYRSFEFHSEPEIRKWIASSEVRNPEFSGSNRNTSRFNMFRSGEIPICARRIACRLPDAWFVASGNGNGRR